MIKKDSLLKIILELHKTIKGLQLEISKIIQQKDLLISQNNNIISGLNINESKKQIIENEIDILKNEKIIIENEIDILKNENLKIGIKNKELKNEYAEIKIKNEEIIIYNKSLFIENTDLLLKNNDFKQKNVELLLKIQTNELNLHQINLKCIEKQNIIETKESKIKGLLEYIKKEKKELSIKNEKLLVKEVRLNEFKKELFSKK